MGNDTLLIFTNLAVCSAGGYTCLCRMAKMTARDTKLSIRLQSTLWFTFFAASGWSFMFDFRPDLMQFVLTGISLAATLIGVPAWRHGPPEYAKRVA